LQHSSQQFENYLRELLLIYFARQSLILATTVIIFLTAAAVAFFATPIYSAQGSVLVRSAEIQRSPDAVENEDVRAFKVGEEDLRSELELLRSPAVIQGAVSRLVDEQRTFADHLDWLRIQKDLKTDLVPDSRVITIALQRDNADQAVAILDAILDEYILRRSQIIYPEGSIEFFTTQLDRFRQQIDDTEQQLTTLAAGAGTPDPSKEIEHNLLMKQHLGERLNTLEADAATLREDLKYLDKVLAEKDVRHFSFLDNETITEMAGRLVDLQIERGKTARHYEDNAQAVTVIDKQILTSLKQLRQEVEDYRNRLASNLAANTEQQSVLTTHISVIAARNLELNLKRIEADQLNRKAELLHQSFATFFKRRQEAEINTRVDSAMSRFYVSILNRAYSTGLPVFPNRPMLLVVGLLAGLVTGFSLGFVREFFDHSFKNPRDLEQYSGLPLLFSVPLITEASNAPAAWRDTEPGQESRLDWAAGSGLASASAPVPPVTRQHGSG
jgi:uncharacterized protein involved in exopolysaccharide biosynthesis